MPRLPAGDSREMGPRTPFPPRAPRARGAARGSVALLLALLATAGAALAEPVLPTPETYRARRRALAQKLGKDPVLVLGAEKQETYRPFRQSNDFFYLTGVEEPEAALLLVPRENREVLFLDPGDPRMERWEGPHLKPGPEARKLTGFEEIRLRSDLPEVLDRLLAGKQGTVLHFPGFPEEIGMRVLDSACPVGEKRRADPLDGWSWREDHIRLVLLKRYPGLAMPEASPAVRGMRELKGPEEASALREAGRVSAEGLKEAMRIAREAAFEYEFEAVMFGACRRLGGQDWAYSPTVGSGPNALIMHYNRNSRKAVEGELVLVDAGFLWNYYASDITRTFPVGGRFPPEQRKAYEDLLKVQKEAVARVRPGVTLYDLHEWVQGQLKALGYGRYLVHFLGHGVGMSVHDPLDPGTRLRPGHVVTIEPGVYLFDRGFGIRIEDTVLVTPSGGEVLTAGVPKEADEIEALIAGAGK